MSTTLTAIAPDRTLAEDLNGPALFAPPGIQYHLTTHSSEQFWYYVCAVLCTGVSGAFIMLRLYTKLCIVRKVDLTDYIAVAAFLTFIPMIVIGRVLLGVGVGVHQWNVRFKDLFAILYWMNINEIIYAPAILLIKLAICLQYLHLLAPNRTVNRFMFFGAWTIIAVNTTFYIITTFLSIFLCHPRELIWNKFVKEGHCINQEATIMFTALFNIISDISILILPVRTVWTLRIPLQKRIGISLLFSTGVVACIANVMIIIFLTRMGGDDADVSYNAAWMGLSAFAEISLGIIVTCMLSLPKLVEAKGKRLLSVLSGMARPFTFFSARSWTGRTKPTSADRRYAFDSASPVPHQFAPVAVPRITLGQTLSQTELTFHSSDYTMESYQASDPKTQSKGSVTTNREIRDGEVNDMSQSLSISLV